MQLVNVLLDIKKHDTDYELRYGLILKAMTIAHDLGYETGVRFDPGALDWPVFCIQLPTGEVSWHCPAFKHGYVEYFTAEKFRRIDEYAKNIKESSNIKEI